MGIETDDAVVELRLLLIFGLDLTYTQLLLRGDTLSESEFHTVDTLVTKRSTRQPLAYITRERWFYGRRFVVSPDVLIPRHETELLVQHAKAYLETCSTLKPLVLDLCTGSGCVGISIACEHRNAVVWCTDISSDAVAIAIENIELHGCTNRMECVVGDLDGGCADVDLFDVIVANPPYIAHDEINSLAVEVRDWEPEIALYADDNGMGLYPRIAAIAKRRLMPGGWLSAECGHTQASTIKCIFEDVGLTNVCIHADLAGIDRVVSARQNE